MSNVRFTLMLDDRTFAALAQLADRERRPVRDQAAHMLTAALELCGLVEKDEHPGGQAEAFEPSRAGDGLGVMLPPAPSSSMDGGVHGLG